MTRSLPAELLYKDRNCLYICKYMKEKIRTDTFGLSVQPIPIVRIGLIGLGSRGIKTLKRYVIFDKVEIRALCDLSRDSLDEAQTILKSCNRQPAETFQGIDGWKRLCEKKDLDLVLICTDWLSHASMAVYAMNQGKHVAVEVPAAMTVKECWQLVDTAEATRRHCMMLENCCYDTFTLCTLEMVRKGLFGEIMHAEGAYIHDLREQCFNSKCGNSWELNYYKEHTGNPYPTHGVGPACKLLGIHQSDRMVRLVSMSSVPQGSLLHAVDSLGENLSGRQETYKLGDMSTSLIMTERGKTIMLQHCVTLPRQYSRIQSLSGTKGYACKYPVPIISFDNNSPSIIEGAELKELLDTYQPEWMKRYDEDAVNLGVTNLMNYRMDRRLIEALQKGFPLDMDVYDAAEWSCLVELTEQSVLGGNIPVDIPDFSRNTKSKEKSI